MFDINVLILPCWPDVTVVQSDVNSSTMATINRKYTWQPVLLLPPGGYSIWCTENYRACCVVTMLNNDVGRELTLPQEVLLYSNKTSYRHSVMSQYVFRAKLIMTSHDVCKGSLEYDKWPILAVCWFVYVALQHYSTFMISLNNMMITADHQFKTVHVCHTMTCFHMISISLISNEDYPCKDPMTPYTPPFWGLAGITGANGGSWN